MSLWTTSKSNTHCGTRPSNGYRGNQTAHA
jgi:hypothetical protein